MIGERAARGLALGGGVCAIALFAVTLSMGGAAWRAWLAAAVLWASAPVGMIGLAMIVKVIPGSWRESLAPPLALAPRLLPVAILAMAPMLVAPGQVYGWAHLPAGGAFRETYLQPLFLLLRSVTWFAVLAVVALRLRRPGNQAPTAIVGLLIYVPFSSLIAVDWLMSLDPDFTSSGFGLYLLSIQITFALGLAIAQAAGEDASAPHRDVLGGVLFTCLALWAYLGFMQYFITWSGDLPSGVGWYLRRGHDWGGLAWLAIAMRAIPAFLLLFGHVRRNGRALAAVALSIAAGAIPELGWLALPAPGPPASLATLGLYLACAIALGALCLGVSGLRPARREAIA